MDTVKTKAKEAFSFSKAKAKTFYANKRRFWGSVVVLLILLLVIFGGKKEEDELLVMERGELQKTVLASGEVTSDVDLDLSFEKSGTVKEIYVTVGEEVKKGKVLTILDQGPELAELKQAQGDLQSARESLDILEAGLVSAENTLEATISAQDSLVEAAYRAMLSDDLEAVPTSKAQMKLLQQSLDYTLVT
jgi:macrolide-specific efflux system membrane fusion protein